jgi:hypothetical protein
MYKIDSDRRTKNIKLKQSLRSVHGFGIWKRSIVGDHTCAVSRVERKGIPSLLLSAATASNAGVVVAAEAGTLLVSLLMHDGCNCLILPHMFCKAKMEKRGVIVKAESSNKNNEWKKRWIQYGVPFSKFFLS